MAITQSEIDAAVARAKEVREKISCWIEDDVPAEVERGLAIYALEHIEELANAVVKMAEELTGNKQLSSDEEISQMVQKEAFQYNDKGAWLIYAGNATSMLCAVRNQGRKRIQELETQLAFHKQQVSDGHTLLQTQGVEMRKLEQKLAKLQGDYDALDDLMDDGMVATAEKLRQQLAAARKLIERAREGNEFGKSWCKEADQFLKETEMLMEKRPNIVCLCGSTRFFREFQRANYEETMAGNVVLSVAFYMHSSEDAHGEKWDCTPEQKIALDALHFRKIEMADEVLILNVNGYIGESTARELAHARRLGKGVRFLEPEKGQAQTDQFLKETQNVES